MSVQENIAMARKVIAQGNSDRDFLYEEYSKVFLMGTENVRAVLGKVKTPMDKALVVRASGDQTLEVVRHGGKIIHNFDINHLTDPGAGLKYGTVRALNYEDFLRFYGLDCDWLGIENREYFPRDLYDRVRVRLDADTRMFFDALFYQYGPAVVIRYFFNLYHHGFYEAEPFASVYIKGEYDQVRENMLQAQISFVQSDIWDLGLKKNGEKYNFIHLSNIAYCLDMTSIDFATMLKKHIVPLLADEGTIIAHYAYGGFLDARDAMFYDFGGKEAAKKRMEYFCGTLEDVTKLQVEQLSVPCTGYGYTLPGMDDVAVTLTRGKK